MSDGCKGPGAWAGRRDCSRFSPNTQAGEGRTRAGAGARPGHGGRSRLRAGAPGHPTAKPYVTQGFPCDGAIQPERQWGNRLRHITHI
ncbi:protein of unknown function [Candidatus Methylocalor cossyra]|uniref:Uncharacterized protein n=1 Tax=Candidatus Methylocalor cossyra TaxID=3108543 RepID=A0ABM9NL41_9GAMM